MAPLPPSSLPPRSLAWVGHVRALCSEPPLFHPGAGGLGTAASTPPTLLHAARRGRGQNQGRGIEAAAARSNLRYTCELASCPEAPGCRANRPIAALHLKCGIWAEDSRVRPTAVIALLGPLIRWSGPSRRLRPID